MRQVELSYRTFGKKALNEIREFVFTARQYKRAPHGNYIIMDADGFTVATWHKPEIGRNALLVIRPEITWPNGDNIASD